MSSVVRVIRIASLIICAIVIASFAIFAITRTRTASDQQTAAVTNQAAPAQRSGHESAVHRNIEEASNTLTTPFAGIVSEADSEWASRGVRLLLALVVYGFGLSYIARVLRVRV
jgi:hypothetical protein